MQNIESGLGYEGVIEPTNEHFLVGGTQKNQAVKTDGVCTCLTSSMGTGGGYVPMHNYTKNLRIRKLTPRECFRLMGFDDNDFEKAEVVNSNTQLYKQAGNSIVVSVVAHIITELLDCGALYGPVKGTSSFDIEAELKMVEIIATVTDDDVDALKAFFRSRGIPKTNYTIY